MTHEARSQAPAVYTDVRDHYDWINSVTNGAVTLEGGKVTTTTAQAVMSNGTTASTTTTSTEDLLSVYAVYDASHVPAEGIDDGSNPVSEKEDKRSTGSMQDSASNVHCTLMVDFLLLYMCHCLVLMFFLH